jgi:hypothetical protein
MQEFRLPGSALPLGQPHQLRNGLVGVNGCQHQFVNYGSDLGPVRKAWQLTRNAVQLLHPIIEGNRSVDNCVLTQWIAYLTRAAPCFRTDQRGCR